MNMTHFRFKFDSLYISNLKNKKIAFTITKKSTGAVLRNLLKSLLKSPDRIVFQMPKENIYKKNDANDKVVQIAKMDCRDLRGFVFH